MIYELFLEGQLVDIRQDLGMQLSYNIDDINKYGSRDTSFSKTIVLPGTAKNNKIFGFISELGSNNTYNAGSANINVNFNVAQTTKAELRANGLLLLKGVFRLTGIVKERDMIEYEGNLFGELGGFIAAIGAGKLEDLDFSTYDHIYNRTNIVGSWDTINGSGYYYPLIDYGTYSTSTQYGSKAKEDYNYLTFRPALYVKEYIDKIFSSSGFTYDSTFLNTAFFKSLIIPNNQKGVFKKEGYNVQGLRTTEVTTSARNVLLSYENTTLSADWTTNVSKNTFTYIGASPATFNWTFEGLFTLTSLTDQGWSFEIRKNGVIIDTTGMGEVNGVQFAFTEGGTISVVTNDTIQIRVTYPDVETVTAVYDELIFRIFNSSNALVEVTLNGSIEMNQTIPKGILQKDFFTWIMKMFNLYITEDKIKEKHLIIEPYVDYYDLSDPVDWTYKVARDKPWNIKPMGMLNGRFFEYKFKEDNDFYNEGYKKKYNESYGDRLEDTGFHFAKDKQTLDIGFSPTVLVQYENRDKIVPAIYKKSSGKSVDQEELTESNIRILIAKKKTCNSWYIRNGDAFLGAALTAYGYAGHFDDPVDPTKDINFGAAQEIYFDPNTYPSDNLFNDYWSGYIAEIADKDSKLLTCHVYLTDLDIAQLDFSKPVFIDGVLWRINKVMDYDATSGELTKVELLKVINNG